MAYVKTGKLINGKPEWRNTATNNTFGSLQDPNKKAAKGSNIVSDAGTVDEAALGAAAPEVPGASEADITEARDAAYNYTTQYYAKDKAQEMEDKKQELANRGIPYDPDPNSLYGRSLQELDRKYQGMYDQAGNLAISQGNDIMTARSTAGATAHQAFMDRIRLTAEQFMKKYGIDKEEALRRAEIASNDRRTAAATDTGPIIGGNAPGFGV